MRIQLQNDSRSHSLEKLRSGPDGRFVAHHLLPAKYKVYARAEGFTGTRAKSARLGDAEVLENGFEVTAKTTGPLLPWAADGGDAMRKPLLGLLLVSAAALAQTVTLEGDVVRKTTGEPLSGVRVAAQGRRTFWAATDATGHFRFNGLPAASWTLSLVRPGWLRRDYYVTIKPQDANVTVRLVATPQAVIAGRIVDVDGWPMRAFVTAAQYRTENGVRQLQRVQGASANDLGEYRIAKLPPGRYYLRVRPQGSWGEDYEPAWYPGADDIKRARPIDLREGQQASVDVRLGPRKGVEVRGQVIWPGAFRSGSLNVTNEELGYTSTDSYPIAADGSFTLRHVPPGKYRLAVATSSLMDDSMPSKYSAVQTIEVSGEDISGITLNVAETVIRDLRGTIACESDVKPGQVQISLQRVGRELALDREGGTRR